MIIFIIASAGSFLGGVLSLLVFLRWRYVPLPQWDLRVTTADGPLVDIDTEALGFLWRFGDRSNDGYLDLLAEHRAGWHVWVKPRGWAEPDRTAMLDGTGALRKDWF